MHPHSVVIPSLQCPLALSQAWLWPETLASIPVLWCVTRSDGPQGPQKSGTAFPLSLQGNGIALRCFPPSSPGSPPSCAAGLAEACARAHPSEAEPRPVPMHIPQRQSQGWAAARLLLAGEVSPAQRAASSRHLMNGVCAVWERRSLWKEGWLTVQAARPGCSPLAGERLPGV